MIADQSVRELVMDTSQSFLVQAPAGSGKTSLLVQRFLCLLAKVEQYPEEILAITFTRKAAAEMRTRVIDALKLAQQEYAPQDSYKLKLWQLGKAVLQRDQNSGWYLIDNPSRLKIQTIDSLSSTIAAQMPVMAQFGCNPQIEPDADYLYDKAVDQFLLDSSNESAWQNDTNSLLLHLDNDRNKIKHLLVHMLKCRDQWLPIIIGTLDAHSIRETLESTLQMVHEQALQNVQDNTPDFLDFDLMQCEPPDSVEQWQVIAAMLLTVNHTWRKTVNAQQGFPAPSDAKDKIEKQLFKERKAAMVQILQQLEDCMLFKQQLIAITKLPPKTYTDPQWRILQSLYTILPILVAQLILVFKEEGVVDFIQVSLAALRALNSIDVDNDLSLALDCKINHILVDEFQDTSLTQFDMLRKLTSQWQPNSGKTLFLVGDPMQSIYRFRKAEVGLFLKAKQYGINNIPLNFVQLTVNFRSDPVLINWFNKVFSASFPESDDIDFGAIKYTASVAANATQNNNATIQCYASTPAVEAQKIVEIINAVKATNPKASIAILVRAKSHLLQIIPTLRAAQINYHAVDLESLAHSSTIQDLLALTKTLLHLDDRIAWLAVLRAPWSGLMLQDLLEIGKYSGTIWQALNATEVIGKLTPDGQQRLAFLQQQFATAIARIGRDSIETLVENLWFYLRGAACLQDTIMQQEAEAYFKFLAEQANNKEIYRPEFLESQLYNLYLHANMPQDAAVQIMTMHKSKGLEFDVVILPSLGKKTRGDSQKLLLLEQRNYPVESILMAPLKPATESHDQIYNYIMWCEEQRHSQESLRQLYVAATRAKQQLYCFGKIGKEGPAQNSLLAQIWPAVACELIELDNIEATIEKTAPIRSVKRFASEYFTNLNHVEIVSVKHDFNKTKIRNDWQRLVGIVIHRTLWQIAREGIEKWDAKKLSKQRNVWEYSLRQQGLDQSNIPTALDIIQTALNNTSQEKFAQKILSSQHQEVYMEWTLTVQRGDEPQRIILDRAFLDHDNNFWIVDYKFVQHEQEITAALTTYHAQLQQYILAVRLLRPQDKIIAGLYFPLQAKWVEVGIGRHTTN
jgi:ATP-dependent exoDNAse (exonuclease V) beta subunit